MGLGSGSDAHHIRFQNIEVRHFRSSVNSMGHHLEFRNLHVHHNGYPVCTAPDGVGCSAYYVRGEYNLIDGGRIHDIHCNGIQFSSGANTPVRHNTVQNVEIFNSRCAGVVAYPTQKMLRNHIHHNGMGINTYGGVEVRGNCLVNNHSIGLLLQSGSNFAVHDNVIVGNPEAAIDTTTYGATLTDYSNNACDRPGVGCTQSGGRDAVQGECAGPQPASPPPPPAPKKGIREQRNRKPG